MSLSEHEYPPAKKVCLEMSADRIFLTPTGWYSLAKLPKERMPTDFGALWDLHPPERGSLRLFGKEVATPRWAQAYGRPYRFSGKIHPALPLPPALRPFMDYATALVPGTNSLLVNWYADGSDNIAYHSDDEKELVPHASIVSISLGGTRRFLLRGNESPKTTTTLLLEHGSVLVMGGTLQDTHKHSVPKTKQEVGRRVNLTFRTFKS